MPSNLLDTQRSQPVENASVHSTVSSSTWSAMAHDFMLIFIPSTKTSHFGADERESLSITAPIKNRFRSVCKKVKRWIKGWWLEWWRRIFKIYELAVRYSYTCKDDTHYSNSIAPSIQKICGKTAPWSWWENGTTTIALFSTTEECDCRWDNCLSVERG